VTGWLAGRLDGVPDSLRERILGSLAGEAGKGQEDRSDIARTLHAAADRLLREALDGPHTRDHALTLLAADALMTYACEAETHAGL
jgi:hypothetical protein